MLQNLLHRSRNFFLPEQKAFDRICVLTSFTFGSSKCRQLNSILFFLPRSCIRRCLVTQSCPTFCNPRGLQPTRLLCSWRFSRQEHYISLPCPPPGDIPNLEIEPRSPTLQVDSSPSEPPGKTKNTGVDSLTLLKEIFSTQELNQGLLH